MKGALLVILSCLVPFSAALATSDWCANVEDHIYASVDHGTITIYHDAAFYNCCPDTIRYEWTLEDHLFTVVETEVNPQCLCYCCFDLTTARSNVPPGDYQIDFTWFDFGAWQHRYLQVVVPDEGQSGDPVLVNWRSACIPSEPASAEALGDTRAEVLLYPVQPNPVGSEAAIRFRLPSEGPVKLAIYSSAGTLVCTLLSENLPAGEHTVPWDCRGSRGERVPQGVYFCGLAANDGTTVRRLLVLR